MWRKHKENRSSRLALLLVFHLERYRGMHCVCSCVLIFLNALLEISSGTTSNVFKQ